MKLEGKMCAMILTLGTNMIFAQSVSWTDPSDGKTITVAEANASGEPIAPRSITVQYNGTRALNSSDVDIISNRTNAPEVDEVTGSGSTWVIHMTRQIMPGETLDIDIDGHVITIEHHPGDVNGDGITDNKDEDAVADAVIAGSKSSAYDLNSDGTVNALDNSIFDDITTSFGISVVWINYEATSSICCCGEFCYSFDAETCDSVGTSTTCPCEQDSCE